MDFFKDPKTILKWFKDPLFQTQDVVENTFFQKKRIPSSERNV